jgi:hypothetical protein
MKLFIVFTSLLKVLAGIRMLFFPVTLISFLIGSPLADTMERVLSILLLHKKRPILSNKYKYEKDNLSSLFTI